MTFEEFLDAALANQSLYPDWRWGQTLFNTLWKTNWQLATYVRGTEADPFYTNNNIPAFLDEVHRYFEAFESVIDERCSNL